MKRIFRIGIASVSAAVLAWVGCAPVVPPDDDAGTKVETPPVAVKPIEPPPVTPRPEKVITPPGVSDVLRKRVEAAIENVERRDLQTSNGFWTVFHGILGMGPRTTLVDPLTGKRVNALEHISAGGELRGLRFIPTRHGLDVQMGPQFVGQGHQDQFVAEMAQWGTPADHKFVVGGKDYTMMDFVRHSQMRARLTDNQELSWAILIVAQYIGTDVTWTNEFGEKLHYDDMIRYELAAPIEPAACGGTHRLFGLSWAFHLHVTRGGKPEGVWLDAALALEKYKQTARQYQNADGSFSTSFFTGRGNVTDRERRINTTGHILEWLALALTDDELRQDWVQNAVSALSLMILDMQSQPIDSGSLYHAIHGLKMYHARVFTPQLVGTKEMPIVLPGKPLPAAAVLPAAKATPDELPAPKADAARPGA